MIIRGLLSRSLGNEYDINVFVQWMQNSVSDGFTNFYLVNQNDGGWPNYPPASMIILNSLAYALHYVCGVDLESHTASSLGFMIKNVASAADILGGTALYTFFTSVHKKRQGLIVSAAYLFNPGILYTSAVWGQIDSIYTMFMVLFIIAASAKKHALGGASVALALLSKVQSIIILPLTAVVFLTAPARSKIAMVIGAICATFWVLIPFAFTPAISVIRNVYTTAIGQQNLISRYGYNIWWIFFGEDSTSMGGTDPIFFFFSARHIGMTLFAISIALIVTAYLCRIAETKTAVDRFMANSTAAAMLAWSFFVWNTEVHERFLFPFCAFGISFLLLSKTHKTVYWVVSTLFTLNLLGILHYTPVDAWLFETFPRLPIAIAWLQVLLLVGMHGLQIYFDIIPFFREKRSLQENLQKLFVVQA